MKLEELISKMPEDQKIKIGTEYGAGFFFAGTLDQYRRRSYGYNRELKNRLKKSVEAAEKRLAKAEMARGELPEAELLVAAGKTSVDLASFKLKAFKPLEEREVLETLTASKIADEDTPLIIYVEGTEDGTYWTIKEAERYGDPFSANRSYRVANGKRANDEE